MPRTEVLGLQLFAVSDCPFQTASSSAFLRRIWSKDRKRAEPLVSIVFEKILYEICLCFPEDQTCPQDFQRLDPKVNPQLCPTYEPFRRVLMGWFVLFCFVFSLFPSTFSEVGVINSILSFFLSFFFAIP